MAKEGGYIPIRMDDIGPSPSNKWENLQAFFDQAQTRFEYGTVLGLSPGNYYIKAMLLADCPAGTPMTAFVARVTSDTTMLPAGTITLKDSLDTLVQIDYTALSRVGDVATFTVSHTPTNLIKAGTIAWTDSPELVNVQAGTATGQLLAVQEGAIGVRVKGGPQLGASGGCEIINNSLVVYSIKQIDDVFQTYQEAVDALESGSLGLPIPASDNNIWLAIEHNRYNEVITITNPYLTVELISGLRGITHIKAY